MAYIQERVKGKKIVSFKIKACLGRDANGKQDFNGVSADSLVPLQSCDLSGTDIILLNKGILRDAFLFHNIPEVSYEITVISPFLT